MTKPPLTIDAGASVRDACRIMRERRVGCILALQGGTLAGILTESDVVKLVAEDRDLKKVKISECMSSPVATIEAGAPLSQAADLMRDRKIKRLAVVVGDELRGVLTVRNVAYAMPEEARRALQSIEARWQD